MPSNLALKMQEMLSLIVIQIIIRLRTILSTVVMDTIIGKLNLIREPGTLT